MDGLIQYWGRGVKTGGGGFKVGFYGRFKCDKLKCSLINLSHLNIYTVYMLNSA